MRSVETGYSKWRKLDNGHSYFCNLKEITDKVLSNIVEYEMVPLLKEYWYDEPIKVKDSAEKLRSSVK